MCKESNKQSKASRKALRALILEDNPCDAALITYELARGGFALTAERVESEAAFIEALEKFSPEIVLSDYDLPGYNGALACKESKARCPGIPFIFVTGNLTRKLAAELFARGAVYCIHKDQLEDLVPLVKIVMRKSSILNTSKQIPNKPRHALSHPASHDISQRMRQNGF